MRSCSCEGNSQATSKPSNQLESPSLNAKFEADAKLLLILICKKLKSQIEQDHNIEQMLESNSKITLEMELYAQIYELESSLRSSTYSSNLSCTSKTLDHACRQLLLKSNISDQVKYLHFCQQKHISPGKILPDFEGNLRDSVSLARINTQNVEFYQYLG